MSTPTARPGTSSRVYVARLKGTAVFDPLGDQVGRVHDVVVLVPVKGAPRAVGLVVEVSSKRRVFVPLTRVTAIDAGAVITTGLVNIRRFAQRATETLVVAELLDRHVTMRDGSGSAVVEDVAIEQQRNRDWLVTKLFVRRSSGRGGLGLRRGEALVVDVTDVLGLAGTPEQQGATALLATLEDLKPADLADVLHDLSDTRRLEVAAELDDERLADVLEELGEEDRVSIVSGLDVERAADVLDAMQPDDAADLVSELPTAKATELLERMEPEEAEDVRRLLAYDEHTAGGLMTTEPLILPPEATVATALAHARRQDVTPALAAMVFVVRPPLETPTGKLLGVVHLQRALREPPHELIGALLDKDIDAVLPKDDIGKVTRLLATYNLTALPVVDEGGRLVGAISVDDVLDHLLPTDWRDADDDVTDEAMTRSAHG
ncbi:magnesium transporter MgtE N-terminal domain-containing protein [Georgenia subflava]|uniref:magnesium transporter MgtE N-terminal domain-containing protein n=1 Tax=Georgenia subflava TaxID=1622177 RepID=UPI001D02241A|nr:CBS domain-containing protein [Georgenia subflava]